MCRVYSTHLSRVLTTELSSRSQAYMSFGGGGGGGRGEERGGEMREEKKRRGKRGVGGRDDGVRL